MANDDLDDGQDSAASASPATPASLVLDSLTSAVEDALTAAPDDVRNRLRSAVDGLDAAVIGPIKDDKYGGSPRPKAANTGRSGASAAGVGAPAADDPDLASMKAVVGLAATQDKATQQSVTAAYTAFDLARKANIRAEDKTCAAARSALSAARDTWTTASEDYAHDVDTATITLNAALETAAGTYTSKHNRDSQSRDQVVFYSMETDVATALQAYQGTVTGEAATLAAAAGALLTASVTYMTTVETAHAQRLHDDATARHDFWVTVEGVLDAS